MVLRKIRLQKRKLQSGGAVSLAEDVNSISTFSPSSIPDLALWVKVNKESLKYSTIAEYIRTQSITVQEKLRELFKNKLDTSIITEIVGVNNSLIRFELDSINSQAFPTFLAPNEISLNYDISGVIPNSFKLVTKDPIVLQNKYSMWSTSTNVNFNYTPTFDQLIISPDFAGYMATHVSKFSEIIVYSRELTRSEKQQVEGYLAYVNNTQEMLPFYHTYLPDLSYLPVLSTVISNIQTLETSLKDSTTHLAEDTSGNIIRGEITDKLNDLSIIRQSLSKGALLSKKTGPITLESIFDSVNRLSLQTVPFTADYIKQKVTEASQLLLKTETHVKSLIPDRGVAIEAAAAAIVASQEAEISAQQTEEIFQDTEREIQAHEFYETLRKRSAAINLNGQKMYGPIYKDFEDRIEVYWDAISYNSKKIGDGWATLTGTFKPLETQIISKAWLKYVPLIDISESEITRRGGTVYSIQYRDTHLNQIQTQYERIRNQIYDGDMAYIANITTIKTKELEAIVKAIENKQIQPITAKTFLPHFKQRYDEITKYMETFQSLLETLMTSITAISTSLEASKRTSVMTAIDELPVISVKDTYRSECETVYIRKMNSSDEVLTGINYIVTDVEGNIHSVINSDGDIDNNFFFSNYMTMEYSKEDLMFIQYHPYKDAEGRRLRQEYKILDELPTLSIIDSLAKLRRPNYWFHKGNSLFEIGRDQINGIHQFVVEFAQYPIQLPKYAIPVGSYFLIQNVGPLPIQVQNPGFPDDKIDMIGYGETLLYIYSGLDETYGSTYYGCVPWREGYIPYDTLTNSPRSAYSVFINELDASIFVKKNLEPVLDFEGYFVKAVTDSKGYTYDIDDVYLANPYSVQSIKRLNLSDLKNKGPRMTFKYTDASVWIVKDIVTGLPVLCNSRGTPGMNEYGYCKFAKTPIMLIDNNIVIRGAFGDIKVSIASTLEVEQMAMLEPFLNFNAVFRSKFVQPYEKGDVKTFVFIGLSKYPILSPKNNFIEAEEWALNPPQEVIYTSAKGQKASAFLLKDSPTIKNSQNSATPYPYISVQDTRSQIEMKKSAKIILNRYSTNKYYILECIDTIKNTYTNIKKLGEKASEGPNEVLSSANDQILADLETYEAYEPSVESIKASLDAMMLTSALKITIDMLDLKMKNVIESVAGTFAAITESIKVTTDLVNDIEAIDNTAREFRTAAVVEIEQRIASVKATFQADAQNLKITGAPEFDRLLKLMIKYKVDFLHRLVALENTLKVRPEYTTEYPNWIKTQKDQIKELNTLLIKIREIEQTDIPRVFSTRESIKRTEYTQKFRETSNQEDSYKAYRDAMNLWLGLPENAEYIKQRPIINTGEPVIKGLSIDLNIFKELKNPSVQRDWQQIDTSAEIGGKIAAELLGPTGALKEKHRFLLVGFQGQAYSGAIESFKEMDLNSIQVVLNNMKLKMDETTNQLIEFETDLAPILKAYENIRSDIRGELRLKLLKNNDSIREKWLELTGKRTAMQTILLQNPDPEKEAKLDKEFEIEPRVTGIISNNPVEYDTISYFKMREIADEQMAVLKELAQST